MDVCETADYVAVFVRHRQLPQELLSFYARDLVRELEAPPRGGVARFLDVGAGTGQFSQAIAAELRRVDIPSELVLLEPSAPFRSRLRGLTDDSSTAVVAASIEQFSTRRRFDLILLSEVAHLLPSRARVFDKLRALLRPGGLIALRYGSRTQVAARPWYRYFPEVHALDEARQPDAATYEALLRERGLCVTTVRVDESRDFTPTQLIEFVRARPFTGFRVVNQAVLAPRVDRFVAAVASGKVAPRWEHHMTWTKGTWRA